MVEDKGQNHRVSDHKKTFNWCTVAGFEDGEVHVNRHGAVSRSRVALRGQPARKQGTQSYNHKELDSTNLNSWKWILPKASREEPGWLASWFHFFEILNGEPNWAFLYYQPTDQPDNKEILFSRWHRASLEAQMVKRLPTMWETRVQTLGWEDLLEKEMATHSSTLAWKIPWMGEPGRLQSMRSQRAGHD